MNKQVAYWLRRASGEAVGRWKLAVSILDGIIAIFIDLFLPATL
jgi:hypothetical protein